MQGTSGTSGLSELGLPLTTPAGSDYLRCPTASCRLHVVTRGLTWLLLNGGDVVTDHSQVQRGYAVFDPGATLLLGGPRRCSVARTSRLQSFSAWQLEEILLAVHTVGGGTLAQARF